MYLNHILTPERHPICIGNIFCDREIHFKYVLNTFWMQVSPLAMHPPMRHNYVLGPICASAYTCAKVAHLLRNKRMRGQGL